MDTPYVTLYLFVILIILSSIFYKILLSKRKVLENKKNSLFEFKLFNSKLFQNWMLMIVVMIVIIILLVFYAFSFIFIILIFVFIFFLKNMFNRKNKIDYITVEKFPVYIEPIEVKTNCNTNKDGCKMNDDYSCYICDGGIHNRHW